MGDLSSTFNSAWQQYQRGDIGPIDFLDKTKGQKGISKFAEWAESKILEEKEESPIQPASLEKLAKDLAPIDRDASMKIHKVFMRVKDQATTTQLKHKRARAEEAEEALEPVSKKEKNDFAEMWSGYKNKSVTSATIKNILDKGPSALQQFVDWAHENIVKDDDVSALRSLHRELRASWAGDKSWMFWLMGGLGLRGSAPDDKVLLALDNLLRYKDLKLATHGLTREEFTALQRYYQQNKAAWDKSGEPLHISKEDEPELPRSLVYYPKGRRQGLYILLKTHGGVEEVGIGAYARATRALHVDSGQVKIFRSVLAKTVRSGEFEATRLVSQHPEYFVAGEPVRYRGYWRPRAGDRKLNEPAVIRELSKAIVRGLKPQKREKIGFIMDFMEGGELLQWKKRLNDVQKLTVAKQIASQVAFLHDKLRIIHRDLKAENIFMSSSGHPKIADWGFSLRRSEKCATRDGTPGMLAPEGYREGLVAEPSIDIWALGCVFSDLVESTWTDWAFRDYQENQCRNFLSDPILIAQRDSCLPNHDNPAHIDYVIWRCLQIDPNQRPTAQQVVDMLQNVQVLV